MKPPTRIALRRVLAAGPAPSPPSAYASLRSPSCCSSSRICVVLGRRPIHGTVRAPATVYPINGQGPPPDPPQPAADSEQARVERRRKQAELLERAQEARAAAGAKPSSSSSAAAAAKSKKDVGASSKNKDKGKDGEKTAALLRRRFWKHAQTREVAGAWEVHLDARPLRHPATKAVIRLPRSKAPLAAALALEWDLLVSALHATRQHLIPLTSLVCRAVDIAEDDAARARDEVPGESIRASVVRSVMRYLDTDSLLCWAPPPRHGVDEVPDSAAGVDGDEEEPPRTLRDTQRRAASDVVGFLTSRVWPGVAIEPVLDEDSIVPRGQPPGTRQVIEGWVAGLDAWELAGLERAVLAGKGLLGAARLVVEWTEGPAGAGVGDGASSGAGQGAQSGKFGVEEAARLASIEVDWQIRQWGEVEDTHDVEKEDLRRQLGSVVLLVSGTGSK